MQDDIIYRRNEFDEIEKMSACWLSGDHSVHRRIKMQMLLEAGSAKEVLTFTEKQLCQFMNFEHAYLWQKRLQDKPPTTYLETVRKNDMEFISFFEEEYPLKLVNIPDPPIGIYYKGSLPKEETPSLAIIGARQCSEYGKCMTEYFADRLARAGIQIISGMAIGIDSVAQKAALAAGGKSFGVLGCGANVIYPPSNRGLYADLVQKGGIISEYPPNTQAQAFLFPERNRIISALSDAVLVVEAREKSGTLITVDMALEQGREVFSIPGRCTDALSSGCNRLLRAGATAALQPEDILSDMKWNCMNSAENEKQSTQKIQISEIAQKIKIVLDILPCTQDEVMAEMTKRGWKYSVSDVCNGLLELELKGIVHRTYGQYRLSFTKK